MSPFVARADLIVLGELLNRSSDYTIHRFDERTGAYIGPSFGFSEGWTALAAAPDGHFYAASNVLGYGIIQDFAPDGALVREVCDMGVVTGMTFGPDGNLYAAGYLSTGPDTQSGVVKFSPRDGRSFGTFLVSGNGYGSALWDPAFGPDGHFYALAASGVVKHDGSTGAPMGIFVPLGRGGLADPAAMAFGPGGHLYVLSRSGNAVLQFNGATGAFMRTLVTSGSGGLSGATDLAFSNGSLLVASRQSNQILRYASDSGAFLGPINGGGMVDGPNCLLATGIHSSTDVDWIDDALPPGATGGATGGDSWTWVTTSTAPRGGPVSGRYMHVSAEVPGRHEHFFNFAQPFPIGPDDILYAYFYSAGQPRQIMLSWNSDRSWEHRAYWGENLINAGVNGTASRYQVSTRVPLSYTREPGWHRLEVPASAVGLAGKTVVGMSFTLFDGGGAWDRAGRKVRSATDATGPALEIVSPEPGPVSGEVVIEATAADPSGVRSVQFFFEGGPLGIPLTSPPYRTTYSFNFSAGDRPLTISAESYDQLGNRTTDSIIVYSQGSPPPPPPPLERPAGVWFERELPAGARSSPAWTSEWNWSPPGPYDEARAHQTYHAFGLHEKYFTGAYTGMAIAPGDTLYVYVRLPSDQPPATLMVSWFAGTWEHRAYWGANRINYGKDGTASRRHMGSLPAGGQWVRLEVPANAVDLGGRTVTGMAFSLFDGSASWSTVGKLGPNPPPGDTKVWFDDGFPPGARPGATGGAWTWMQGSPAAHAGAAALHSTLAAGLHEQHFNFAWETLRLEAGDRFFIHVYVDPANPPREIVLSFCADNWEHRAYWGENLLRYAPDGTPAQRRIGPLPEPGRWARLEVAAEAVGLPGLAVKGLSITLYDGRATFDLAGRLRP
ncbi:MAG TPA: Ig-like domain-containing protein [Opitutaceae bacterium]|nr:Ig-like domain-containing protein [Opitutaceae bacterium]